MLCAFQMAERNVIIASVKNFREGINLLFKFFILYLDRSCNNKFNFSGFYFICKFIPHTQYQPLNKWFSVCFNEMFLRKAAGTNAGCDKNTGHFFFDWKVSVRNENEFATKTLNHKGAQNSLCEFLEFLSFSGIAI